MTQKYGAYHTSYRVLRDTLPGCNESNAARQDVCEGTKKVQSRRNKNKSYFIVHQHMKSLKEYNLPLYKKYYAHELSILKPAKKWKIHPSNVSSFNSL